MGVVGVLVRVEHGLDPIDFGGEQLLAQVAAGVDDDAGRLVDAVRIALDQQRAAAAAVLRVFGVADAPVAADARHAAGGPAAHDGCDDALCLSHHGAAVLVNLAFENKRKKFEVVSLPSCSRLMPRTSATLAAV